MKGKTKNDENLYLRGHNPNATPTTAAKKRMDLGKPHQPSSKGNFPKKGKNKRGNMTQGKKQRTKNAWSIKKYRCLIPASSVTSTNK
jgi:hypothetical protein